MAYILQPLPYAYDALEPYIDALTMEIHYTKHHQTYVDNLNKALKDYPELQGNPVIDLLRSINELPEEIKSAVRNNGGGYFNHTMFWPLMKHNGGGEPKGRVADAINQKFGTFAAFKEQFNAVAASRFGSGWAWLSLDKQGSIILSSTANQDNPLAQGHNPFFGLDVWEHAYYLKYYNRRADYIAAWWNIVNWQQVEENYCLLIGK